MKRTPLKRNTPLKRQSIKSNSNPSKPRKPLKAKPKAVPKDIYQQVLARDGGCVARLLFAEVRCAGRIDPHHALMRSQGGKDALEDLIAVCRAHHEYIHANPARSYELGLLRHRAPEEYNSSSMEENK